MSYNGTWEIIHTVDATNSDLYDTPPVLGNGKIAILPSFDGSKTIKQTHITQDGPYVAGNTIETFNTGLTYINSGQYEDKPDDITTTQLKINMYNGIMTYNTYNPRYTLDSDVYVHYNYPFATINTKTFTGLSSNFTIQHEIHAPTTLIEPVFTNQLINNGNSMINIFCATAKTGTGKTICTANAYITENCSITYNGFNAFETHKAFNKFSINYINNSTIKVHFLSVHMTSDDFDTPEYEVQKVILNMVNAGMAKIRSTHVGAWSKNWLSDIQIMSKEGITQNEEDTIKQIKQSIRMSLYTIYSLSREIISLGGNNSIGFIDFDGTLLSQCDMFLVPILLMLKPGLAKSILDYRFHTLSNARHIAASYGFKGSKFPYENDVLGYKNTLYWTTNDTQTVFNTGLISINVWNYYRVTLDNSWLLEFGHPILKNNANFFVSILNETSNIENTFGISGIKSEIDNTLTNTIAQFALKMAIESSYLIGSKVPAEWKNALQTIPLHKLPTTNIYKFDNDLEVKTDYRILEPLFLFTPYYERDYIARQIYQNTNKLIVMKENQNYHNTKLNNLYENNTINIVLNTILNTTYTQYNPSTESKQAISTEILDFINKKSTGIFSTFTATGNNSKVSDINIAGAFIFMLLQGIVQMTIKGGVSETNFYYEEMTIKKNANALMPDAWYAVNVKINGDTSTTYNNF
jgi:hypothetical protein